MFRAAASLTISPLLRRRSFVASSASLLSSSTTKYENTWQNKFEELKNFVEKRDGTLEGILTEDPILEKWIRLQRSLYQQKSARLQISDRREKLESLGIPLEVYEDLWEQQYEKLKEFKTEHGHTNVPILHDEKLFYWVSRQRKLYKKVLVGGLAEDRVEKLRELDFIFDLHKAAWMERYEDLAKFKSYHGHCIVPHLYTSNPSLGVWVDQQRQHYNKLINGREHESSMTEERIELLNAVEFCWNALDAKWEGQFEELKEHVRINGHGVAPTASSRQLASWLTYQRKLYRQMQDGKQVSLTTERLQKLRSLGFLL
jgi:hypothetical protein